MTEDDTFRKLKQIPFNELREVIKYGYAYGSSIEWLEALIKPHGWTIEEYNKARYDIWLTNLMEENAKAKELGKSKRQLVYKDGTTNTI